MIPIFFPDKKSQKEFIAAVGFFGLWFSRYLSLAALIFASVSVYDVLTGGVSVSDSVGGFFVFLLTYGVTTSIFLAVLTSLIWILFKSLKNSK